MYPRTTVAGQCGSGRPRRLRAGMGATALAAALALGISGCGSSSGGSGSSDASWTPNPKHPVTITFANWADSETATRPGIEAMIKAFEKANPGIKVKSQPISFTDIGHQLLVENQSGNTPDIAELSGNDTIALAAAGALADVSDYLGSSKSEFMPSELKESTYNGKLIAIPWTVNPPGLWYNKTLMKGAGLDPNSPPKTISELMTDLAKIRQKYPKVLALGMDVTNRDFALSAAWPWMKTYNAQPFSGDTPTADTPAMKQYLQWMRDMANKGYLSTGKKIGDFRPLAAQNQVAFEWDQPVLQGVVQTTNHETNAQFYANWGVAVEPTGPSGKSYSVELGHQLSIFDKSSHKKAAYIFAKWLATSDQAVTQYTIPIESSLAPLANPSAAVAKLQNTPVLQAFKNDVLPTVANPQYGPTYSEAVSPVMSGVQSAVTSSTPIDSVASTIQSALKTAFQ